MSTDPVLVQPRHRTQITSPPLSKSLSLHRCSSQLNTRTEWLKLVRAPIQSKESQALNKYRNSNLRIAPNITKPAGSLSTTTRGKIQVADLHSLSIRARAISSTLLNSLHRCTLIIMLRRHIRHTNLWTLTKNSRALRWCRLSATSNQHQLLTQLWHTWLKSLYWQTSSLSELVVSVHLENILSWGLTVKLWRSALCQPELINPMQA